MTPTTLIFPITPDVHKRITDQWPELSRSASEKGIDLSADGTFTGKATGRVTIAHDRVSVLITDKPWLIPMAAINAELRRLFS